MEVSEAYENIEKIVTYGFLPLGIRYGSNTFILKTITDKEYKFISFLSTGDNIDLALFRLAYSTYMVNGVNYLEDRSKQIYELLKFYKSFPTPLFKQFIELANKIHSIYLDSVDFLEGFCYTNRSRHLWKVFQKQLPNIGFYHGTPGTFNTGLNIVQENWTIINQNLDTEEDYETQFRLSLMIASSFAGKAAKEMGGRYDFQKKELSSLRDEIKKYGYDKKRVIREKREKEWAAPIRTREDLVRELNRQMSGDKDKHDLFIKDWIKRQAEKAEEAKESAEKKQKQFQDNLYMDTELEKLEPSRVVTPEEMEKLLSSQKYRKPGMGMPSDSYGKSEEKERVLKKLSGTVIGDKK